MLFLILIKRLVLPKFLSMPKFRLLSHEELKEFEKEFIDYLVVNGITGEDWGRIKENQPKEAIKIMDLFSDVIFEAVMRKIEFLEIRTPKEVQTFQSTSTKLVMVGMKIDPESEIDFTISEDIEKAMQAPPGNIEVYTASREYKLEREQELFAMTENGARITDGKLFKALSLALAESKES